MTRAFLDLVGFSKEGKTGLFKDHEVCVEDMGSSLHGGCVPGPNTPTRRSRGGSGEIRRKNRGCENGRGKDSGPATPGPVQRWENRTGGCDHPASRYQCSKRYSRAQASGTETGLARKSKGNAVRARGDSTGNTTKESARNRSGADKSSLLGGSADTESGVADASDAGSCPEIYIGRCASGGGSSSGPDSGSSTGSSEAAHYTF